MAYINATAILTRLREVLDSGAGSLRAIAAGRFDSGLYAGLDIPAQTLRALTLPIIEPSITSVTKNDASPPSMHSMQLYDIEVEINVVRAATLEHKLTDLARDTLAGLAVQDSDVVAQALTYPGNLTTTTASMATGLVSGLLTFESSTVDVDLSGETSARIASTHTFKGVVNVTAATS